MSNKFAACYLLLVTMLSCEEKDKLPIADFYPFMLIDRVEIIPSETNYQFYISEPIRLFLQGYDKSGKKVAIPDSLAQIFLNGNAFDEAVFTPSDTGSYVVNARFNHIESPPVTILARNVIQSVDVALSSPVFYLREDTDSIAIRVFVRDERGNNLKLRKPAIPEIYIDGIPYKDTLFLPGSQVGKYKFKAKFLHYESEIKELEVLDPNDLVRSLTFRAYSRGGTAYGIAGNTVPFLLEATPLDGNNRPLPFTKNLEYLVDGVSQYKNTFSPSKPGTYRVSAKGYGHTTEAVEIIIREEQYFQVEKSR